MLRPILSRVSSGPGRSNALSVLITNTAGYAKDLPLPPKEEGIHSIKRLKTKIFLSKLKLFIFSFSYRLSGTKSSQDNPETADLFAWHAEHKNDETSRGHARSRARSQQAHSQTVRNCGA